MSSTQKHGIDKSNNYDHRETKTDYQSETRSDFQPNNYHKTENNDKDYQSNNDDSSEDLKPKNYDSESEEEYHSANEDKPESRNIHEPKNSETVSYYQPINYDLIGPGHQHQSDNDQRKKTRNDYQSNNSHSNERNDYHSKDGHYSGTRDESQFQRYSSESEDDNHNDDSERGRGDRKQDSHRSSSNSRRNMHGDRDERHNHGGHKPAGHVTNHHQPRKTRVNMPSGLIAYIVRPNTSGWNCNVDKTKLIKLHPKGRMGREEYQIVANEMESTRETSFFCYFKDGCYTGYKILKIQKIVNGCFWKKYRKFQAVVHKEVGYINEKMLFHGSDKIDELLDGGFDERYSNIDGRFGAGIYFARNSSKSNQYAFGNNGSCKKHNDKACYICVRQILLCRVTLGKVHQLAIGKSFSHAPPSFHSVEGTPGIRNTYQENIIYRGEQAYPEYLISYKIVK